MKIELTGIAADIYGDRYIEIPGVTNISVLKAGLIKEIPELIRYSYLVVVNNETVSEDMTLSDTDNVVIMHPFSGG